MASVIFAKMDLTITPLCSVRSFIAQLLRYARLFEAGSNQRFEECESDIDRGETAGKSEKGPKKKKEKRKVEEKRKGDKS